MEIKKHISRSTIKLELKANLFDISSDLDNPREILEYVLALYPNAINIDITDVLEESDGIVYTVIFINN